MGNLRKPGRPQDQDKRCAILASGRALMALHGFDFSMDDIARHAGVARQTVYNVYPGRDAVIAAVVEQSLDRLIQPMGAPGTAQDISEVLGQLAHTYLDMIGSPERVSIMRAMAAPQSIAKGYGSALYSIGPQILHERLANYLKTIEAGGAYSFPNPALAADMFISAAVGSRQLRSLLGVDEPDALGNIHDRVTLAVKMFLQGHKAGA
jgi:TetR/AcrR family transcriptional regulator, mexJK operon transcriptional repressor